MSLQDNMHSSLQSTKRAQSAIEFLVAIGIVTIFFTLVVIFFIQRYTVIEQTTAQRFVASVSQVIQDEIFLAKSFSGNYNRNFTLPETFNNLDVTYSLSLGRELTVSFGNVSHITFLPTYVYGYVSPGHNSVLKKGSLLGICSTEGSCSEETLFNLTGSVQCSSFDGLWTSCDIQYGSRFVGFRVECGESPANLELVALDRGITFYNESSSFSEGEYIMFSVESSPILIDRSGYFSLGYTCGSSDVFYESLFYVPYGELVFRTVSVGGSSCSFMSGYYNCTEDELFTLTSVLDCIGGECGDAIVWLDPISDP